MVQIDGLQRFPSAVAAELRRVVVDLGSRGARVVAVMRFRIAVALAVQGGESDIDDFRLGLTEHLTAAGAAKASRAALGTAEANDVPRPGRDPETLHGNTRPGQETGTVRVPAHGAVAMPAEQRRQRDLDLHDPAKTTTGHT